MEFLPQEILGDILLRLPMASLMQLCCVSKKMNDFIYGSYFVDLHCKHSQSHCVLLIKGRPKRWWNSDGNDLKRMLSICPLDGVVLDDQSRRPIDLPLPFPTGSVVRLFGSCNGIVCMSVWSRIHLFNPTTRKFMPLPDSSFAASNYAITHGVGIGFDSLTDNYLVIRLVWFLGALNLDASTIHHDFEVSSLLAHIPPPETLEETLVALETLDQDEGSSSSSSSRGIFAQGWPTLGAEIYNLKTNSWRKLDVVLPHIDERNSAVVLDGRYFHWCTKNKGVLCFDMTTQTFRQMEMPGDVSWGNRRYTPTWNLGLLEGYLAFLFFYQLRVEVWVMEGYGMKESWVKKYSIRSPVPSFSIPSISCWNDGKLFIVSGEELISCYLQDDSDVGEVKEYGGICRAPNYSLSYLVYQQSLVSLDRGHNSAPWRKM